MGAVQQSPSRAAPAGTVAEKQYKKSADMRLSAQICG
jgi:hypothetical protein